MSRLVVQGFEVSFEELLALFFRGGFAVERDGGDPRRRDAAGAVRDFDFLGPAGAGEVAVMVLEAIRFRPVEVGVLKVAVDGVNSLKGSPDEGTALEVAVMESEASKISKFKIRIRGFHEFQPSGEKRAALKDRSSRCCLRQVDKREIGVGARAAVEFHPVQGRGSESGFR